MNSRATSRQAGRPPGRPTAASGPAVDRIDLLRIAARMIGERGFAGSSIRALAAEAGVSHGTVQHHFPTKHDLWRALVDEVLVPDFAAVRGQMAPEFADGLETVIATRLKQAMTRPGLSGAVLMDNSDGAAERLAYLADATLPMRTQAIMQLQSLVDTQALRPVNPKAIIALNIALACLASANAALRTFLDIDISDDEQRERLAADITDVIMHGISPGTD